MLFSISPEGVIPLAPPMLAPEVGALPRGEDWMYEFQWGGERVRAVKRDAAVRLLARDGRDLVNRFPRVGAAMARLRSAGAIVDGEIIMLDGYPAATVSFLARRVDDISQSPVALLAYDLLSLNGVDLRPVSLLCRRVKLASLLQGTTVILSPLVERLPEAALQEAARLGLPGVVAKRAGSPYHPSAVASDWVKVTLPLATCAGPGHGPPIRRAA